MFKHYETEVCLGQWYKEDPKLVVLHDFGSVTYVERGGYEEYWTITVIFKNNEVYDVDFEVEDDIEGTHTPLTKQEFFNEIGSSGAELNSILAEAKILYHQKLKELLDDTKLYNETPIE